LHRFSATAPWPSTLLLLKLLTPNAAVTRITVEPSHSEFEACRKRADRIAKIALCFSPGKRTLRTRARSHTTGQGLLRECCRRDTTGKTPKTRRLFCPTSQARRAKIFIFPKDGNYDLTKPARLDTGDVMAIRHQT
jgi:hypothetical protein